MDLLDCIGNTPYIPLNRLSEHLHLPNCIYAKLEMLNPFGSIKDRAALSMIKDAEEQNKLHSGSILLEATSGNMGIALSGIAALKGYKSTIIMPDNMPWPRQKMIKSLGAQLILTPEKEGMAGAEKAAEQLLKTNACYYHLNQFQNPFNILAHEQQTGPEILHNSNCKVDCIVAGVGTGATLIGCARFLKRHIPDLKVMAVEPAASAVLQGKYAGNHTIYGIGAGFVPPLLDFKLIDRIYAVQDEDAYHMRDILAKIEGIYAGPSSGAVLSAAVQIAKDPSLPYRHIATLLPDSGERY